MPRPNDYDDEDPYADRYEGDQPRRRRDDPDYDDQRHDYQDYERPRRGRDAAQQRVMLPAIFLMVIGGLGFLLAIANAIFAFSGAGADQPGPFGKPDPNMKNDPAFITGQVIAVVVTIGWGLLVFFGGLQMKNLKSRGFVMFSAILAMLPCNWCCLLGIPFGIWALVVLNDETVKRSF